MEPARGSPSSSGSHTFSEGEEVTAALEVSGGGGDGRGSDSDGVHAGQDGRNTESDQETPPAEDSEDEDEKVNTPQPLFTWARTVLLNAPFTDPLIPVSTSRQQADTSGDAALINFAPAVKIFANSYGSDLSELTFAGLNVSWTLNSCRVLLWLHPLHLGVILIAQCCSVLSHSLEVRRVFTLLGPEVHGSTFIQSWHQSQSCFF